MLSKLKQLKLSKRNGTTAFQGIKKGNKEQWSLKVEIETKIFKKPKEKKTQSYIGEQKLRMPADLSLEII